MLTDFLPHLAGAAIRAFALGLLAVVGLLLLRIRSSAARHATWTVVLAGMLLQMPLGVMAPAVPIKALPAPSAFIQPRVMESTGISAPAAQPDSPTSPIRTKSNRGSGSLSTMVTGIYLAISILLFVRMAGGYLVLRQLSRDARSIPSLGPDIFESVLCVVPGSVGCFLARILLPPEWKDWHAVKLQAVLSHERAHIRRRDWLIRVASQANICIFWFHPLAWWIDRELAHLAEEACDDVALSELEDREEYAATLVDIARTAAAGGGVLKWRAVSMATDSNVMRRVNRILNRRFPMKPFGRLAWLTLLACGLPVIYLSAAVRLIPANRRSPAMQVAQATPNRPPSPPPPLRSSPQEDSPVTMCILIDNSGSMWNKRASVNAAALALVKASTHRDEVCIIDFNDEVFNGLPHDQQFTSDIDLMKEAIAHTDSRGGKAMRDAIRMAIDQVDQTAHNGTNVLVLVTEGNDTSSTITQEQLLDKVSRSGIPVYCVGLLSEDNPRRVEAARLALGQLAEASGGMDYYPHDLAEVESISSGIANEVRRH